MQLDHERLDVYELALEFLGLPRGGSHLADQFKRASLSIGLNLVEGGLKTNTVKRRTLSLYKQGCFWYDAIPAMPDDRLVALMSAYDECVREQAVLREIFGLL